MLQFSASGARLNLVDRLKRVEPIRIKLAARAAEPLRVSQLQTSKHPRLTTPPLCIIFVIKQRPLSRYLLCAPGPQSHTNDFLLLTTGITCKITSPAPNPSCVSPGNSWHCGMLKYVDTEAPLLDLGNHLGKRAQILEAAFNHFKHLEESFGPGINEELSAT